MRRRRLIIYGAAMVLAGVAVIGGFVLVRQTEAELRERCLERLEEQRAAGEPLPVMPRGDLDGFDLSREVGVRIPAGLMWRVDLSLWMLVYWPYLIPLAFAVGLGIAWVFDTLWLSRTARNPSAGPGDHRPSPSDPSEE